MTLDQPDFAELVLLILAAPIIIGAVWRWMISHSRQDAIRRWDGPRRRNDRWRT